MATIRLKKRASSGSTGAPSSLAPSEVAFNEADKVLYYGYGDAGDGTSSSIISVAGEGAVMHLGNVNQTAAGNKTFSGNVVVSGNFTVNGTTSTLNTTNSVVKDTLIELGNGTSGTPANDAGLVIERGSSNNAFMGWDESLDQFHLGTGTFTGASTGNLSITTGTLKANLVGNVTGNTSGSAGSFTAGSASNLNSGTIPNARIADDSITEAQLDIHNTPTTNYILKYTSNGMEWAAQGAGGDVNQNAFSNIAVSGQSTVAADSTTDTLTLVAGSNVTITTNASGDSVTIASTDTNTTYSVGDGGLTQNNFTNTLKSKLDGIATSAIADIVNDTSPQLGGNLDVQTREVTTSTSNGNVKISPNGTGVLEVKGDTNAAAIQLNCENNSHGIKLKSPAHSAGANYTLTFPNSITNGQFLKTDGSGNLSWAAVDLTALSASNLTSGTVPTARIPTLNQNTTGSAATLTTARTIAGVSFNGSANISLNNNAITNGAGYVTSSIINALSASNLSSGTIPSARVGTVDGGTF